MDVEQDLLAGLTGDAVDVVAGRKKTRACKDWSFGNRHAFRSQWPRSNRVGLSHSGDRRDGCKRCYGADRDTPAVLPPAHRLRKPSWWRTVSCDSIWRIVSSATP